MEIATATEMASKNLIGLSGKTPSNDHNVNRVTEDNNHLANLELLVHIQPDLEVILASDASDYGVGAVLSHKVPDETGRLIGYVSRSLSAADWGYSNLEKEAFAIVFGVKKFNHFLY